MLKSNSSFSFETVFSHPSKIEFIHSAKNAGYKVYLYFISTVDPMVNLERVKTRVKKGGHGVPEQKIIERYSRTMNNLFEAFLSADRTFFFDNSMESEGTSFDFFAEKKNDRVYFAKPDFPKWFNDYLLEKLQ